MYLIGLHGVQIWTLLYFLQKTCDVFNKFNKELMQKFKTCFLPTRSWYKVLMIPNLLVLVISILFCSYVNCIELLNDLIFKLVRYITFMYLIGLEELQIWIWHVGFTIEKIFWESFQNWEGNQTLFSKKEN